MSSDKFVMFCKFKLKAIMVREFFIVSLYVKKEKDLTGMVYYVNKSLSTDTRAPVIADVIPIVKHRAVT